MDTNVWAEHVIRRQPGIAHITLSLALAACADGAQDQPPRRCDDGCSLAVDTVWSSDPANPDLSITYSVIERGDSLVVVDALQNKHLVVLGPSGATVRVVGRRGDGPGEYRSISEIRAHDSGDIYVFDRRRLTVLDSALQVAFITPLGGTVEKGVVLADRTSVVDGERRVGDSTFTLNLVGDTGQLLNSFDAAKGGATSRFIARGRDNTVWSAPRVADAPTYEINRWDPRTGRLLQSIRDSPPWFAWEAPRLSANASACRGGDRSACEKLDAEPHPRRPPMPTILAMWEAADGILWIISYKADAKWAQSGPGDTHRTFDSVLEARDATTGDLIVTREFDQYLTGFTSSGRAVMQELDDQDQPKHTLLRMSIRRGAEPSR